MRKFSVAKKQRVKEVTRTESKKKFKLNSLRGT